jgi:hypothetical protein
VTDQSDLIAAMVRSTTSSVPKFGDEAAPPSLLQRQTRRISLDAPGRNEPLCFTVGVSREPQFDRVRRAQATHTRPKHGCQSTDVVIR